MRLLRDTSGTFDNAKDSLQRDLTTLQRSFDTLLATQTADAARLTAIEAALAAANLSIDASGQVANAAGGKGLVTVAHDQSMLGDGRAIRPLSVSSAWLASHIPASGVSVLNVDIAPFTGLNTTPQTLVAAAVGYVHMPVFYILSGSKPAGTAWTNGNSAFTVAWDKVMGSPLPGTSLGLATPAAVKAMSFQVMNINSGWAGLTNMPLIIYTAANIAVGGVVPTNVRLTLGYITKAFADF